jgi:phosphoribosyl 1,2-cyclic phosphodiesterase
MSYDNLAPTDALGMHPDVEAAPATTLSQLRATCWGTRGSIPSPGQATARFGGNTTCLEVMAGDRRLIFDGGTGIHVLGRRIAADPASSVKAHLFLTHFHWDHIQGIPFFGPLYRPETEMVIHGSRQKGVDIQTLFAGQMGPIYFPIPFEALSAQLTFEHLTGEPWHDDGFEVDALRVRHPADTYGYRVRTGEASVAFVPDNELVGGNYHVDAPTFRKQMIDFLRDVDVLFHDAMFTESEYKQRVGWGHSTYEQAVALAEEAGVRRLFLFHHAPDRTDLELMQIVDDLRNDLARRGSPLEIEGAAEGEELQVQERKR